MANALYTSSCATWNSCWAIRPKNSTTWSCSRRPRRAATTTERRKEKKLREDGDAQNHSYWSFQSLALFVNTIDILLRTVLCHHIDTISEHGSKYLTEVDTIPRAFVGPRTRSDIPLDLSFIWNELMVNESSTGRRIYCFFLCEWPHHRKRRNNWYQCIEYLSCPMVNAVSNGVLDAVPILANNQAIQSKWKKNIQSRLLSFSFKFTLDKTGFAYGWSEHKKNIKISTLRSVVA